MVKKVPRWESELWSYMSSSDGIHCPTSSQCPITLSGDWCPVKDLDRFRQLSDHKRFAMRDYNFVKRGTCGGIFAMVGKLAWNFLKKGGVFHPPVPSELVSMIAEKQPVEVRLVPITNYHGALWHFKDGWVIQLKESDPPDEQRVTLFHETFHIVAHTKSTPVFSRRGRVPAPFNEMLASYFAVRILLPSEWIKEKWTELRDIKKMAELFYVPQRILVIRLKRLGLI